MVQIYYKRTGIYNKLYSNKKKPTNPGDGSTFPAAFLIPLVPIIQLVVSSESMSMEGNRSAAVGSFLLRARALDWSN